MQKLIIAENPMLPETWVVKEFSEDPCGIIVKHFDKKWPPTAKIYKGKVSQENDITPQGPDGIEIVQNCKEPLWVLVYPGEVVTGMIITTTISLLFTLAISLILGEEETVSESKKIGKRGSPNNSLGRRLNAARSGERVPDILGQVRSTPDLIALPYVMYENLKQVEISTMCVGVGVYSISGSSIKDGEVSVSNIPNMSAEVYNPFNVPKTVSFPTPAVSVGDPILEPVRHIFEVEQVDVIEVQPFNEFSVYSSIISPDSNSFGDINIRIAPGGATAEIVIPAENQQSDKISSTFAVGDRIMVDTSTVAPDIDFSTPDDGTDPFNEVPTAPTITGITFDSLSTPAATGTLDIDIPAGSQALWESVRVGPNAVSSVVSIGFGYDSIIISPLRDDNTLLREFSLDSHDGTFEFTNRVVICNFLYPTGLTVTDSNYVNAYNDIIEVVVKEGAPGATGAFISTVLPVTGKSFSKDSFGVTMKIPIAFTGQCSVSVRRNVLRRRVGAERQRDNVETLLSASGLSNHVNPPVGRVLSAEVNDTMQWTHCYDTSEPIEADYGNITMMMTKVRANDTTRKIKERRISCTATRNIRILSGGAVPADPTIVNPTQFFASMLVHVLTDPLIGNYSTNKIDMQGLEDVQAQLDDYFQLFSLNSVFGHTFDNLDTSLEETVNSICQACFCKGYRDGDIFKIRAILPEDSGTLLLNHRNIIPDSQQIVHQFGVASENDSIEVPYTIATTGVSDTVVVPDPTTNTTSLPSTFVFPRKTRKVNITGISSRTKAVWHAIRIYNKMIHQTQSMNLECTQEASLLIDRDRVLVADRTRVDSEDGYIVQVNGLILTTSQPTDLTDPSGHTIFLQHSDGTTESQDGVVQGVSPFQVVLPQAPASAIITDESVAVQTNYMIVANGDARPNSFMLEEKNASSSMVFSLGMSNYSHAYYHGDSLIFWGPMYTAPSETTINVAPRESNAAISSVTGTLNLQNNARGLSWRGDGANQINVNINIAQIRNSYTKSWWMIPISEGGTVNYFREDGGTIEFISQTGSTLIAGHTTPSISYDMTADIAAGLYHHYCLVYDDSTNLMSLYRNGVLVDSATISDQIGNFSDHVIFQDSTSFCDEPMMWQRAMLPEEVKHLYQTTIRHQDWVALL